jgi:hypothetical protein
VLVSAGAWIAGSVLMGLYLWISLNAFREHVTEAFSALRIEDWKGFLRLRLATNGEIEVFFLGIRKVPRRWTKRAQGAAGPAWIPAGKAGSGDAHLEDYVRVGPSAGK